MDYKQPDFYHFSDDSIKLAKKVINDFVDTTQSLNLLDLCSGCGVIPIEISKKLFQVESIEMVEIQESFNSFIESNLKNLLDRKVSYRIKNLKVSDYIVNEKFSIITCNPPYFIKDKGRVSPNKEKHICRTFEYDSPETILKALQENLKDDGRAYVLIPNNIEQWNKEIKNKKNIQLLEKLSRASIYLVLKSDAYK